MKKVVSFEQALGGDGGKVGGAVGIEGDQLKAELSVTYPIEKVVEPALKVVDDLVDKLEKLIPGDQTAMAAKAKADARAALVAMIVEKAGA